MHENPSEEHHARRRHARTRQRHRRRDADAHHPGTHGRHHQAGRHVHLRIRPVALPRCPARPRAVHGPRVRRHRRRGRIRRHHRAPRRFRRRFLLYLLRRMPHLPYRLPLALRDRGRPGRRFRWHARRRHTGRVRPHRPRRRHARQDTRHAHARADPLTPGSLRRARHRLVRRRRGRGRSRHNHRRRG